MASKHIDTQRAPTSTTAWQQYNKYGYRVERTIIDRNTKPSSRSVRVGPDTLRPWPLERFKSSFPEDHPYAGPVAQLLYGEPTVKNAKTQEPTSAEDAATELTMRYSFTLLMADMDAPIAQALGLRFADHDVKPDAYYLYRVITLDPEHPDTAMIGVNRALGAEVIPPCSVPIGWNVRKDPAPGSVCIKPLSYPRPTRASRRR